MNKAVSPKVVVIVLNWNQPQHTLECVAACRLLKYDSFEILVVDNASTDQSAALFLEQIPDVQVLQNSRNEGYAGGNNAGIRRALEMGAEYLFILNNDAAPSSECLSLLIEAAVNHPEAGIMAPKVLQWDHRDRVNSLGTAMDWLHLRPRLSRYGQKDDRSLTKPFSQEILMGCALFLSRQTVELIGELDENFFLIHEDADWCFRARAAGLQTWVVPRACVYHKESKSLGGVPALSYYYSIRNFLYLAQKHARLQQAALTVMGTCLLILKSSALFIFGSSSSRKRSRIFFLALMDFLKGSMGRCKRKLV